MSCIKVIIISSLTIFICNSVKCLSLRNMLIFLDPFNTVFHIRCINIHTKQLIIIFQDLVCTSSHKNTWTFLCQALHCLFLRMKHLLRNCQAFFILRFFRHHYSDCIEKTGLAFKFIDDFLADSMPLCFLQQKLTVVTGNSHFF